MPGRSESAWVSQANGPLQSRLQRARPIQIGLGFPGQWPCAVATAEGQADPNRPGFPRPMALCSRDCRGPGQSKSAWVSQADGPLQSRLQRARPIQIGLVFPGRWPSAVATAEGQADLNWPGFPRPMAL
ncbi:hypothetical protein PCASD_07868 [Puccinia coronata f. sp. avenae]|uniref:Uncharacterized protein n=1 Tax=Puccinia coronata f. sp. avenae TaxID=200324 RepID=A0A2N5UQQ2_9BASI|nr:hypothetical protein PCASD_07868 [Puccinia coronata f. sp. avenae]